MMADGARKSSFAMFKVMGLICMFLHVQAIEVELFATGRQTLGWVTNRTGTARGWREQSWNPVSESVRRIYAVCDVSASNVSNWLRLPYIERGRANRVYIEMTFTMRNCKTYTPQDLKQCQQAFQLMYYQADRDFATAVSPSWIAGRGYYNQSDKVVADYTFSTQDEVRYNTEVRGVQVTKNGLYFAFYDTGACMSLLKVRVFYKACPATKINFANFPQSATSAGGTDFVSVVGTCVPNAVQREQPTYLCQASGIWAIPDGGCHCKAGYQPSGQNCTACPVGQYKHEAGNDRCKACPANSQALRPAATMCGCIDGHYRGDTDKLSVACATPPDSPRNLSVRGFDQTVVSLVWQHPHSNGGRADLTYTVQCEVCSVKGCNPCDGAVHYKPAKEGFSESSVELSGLNPSTEYLLKVYARTGIGMRLSDFNHAELKVTTTVAIKDQVSELKVLGKGSNWIAIAWSTSSGNYQRYEVKYAVASDITNVSAIGVDKPTINIGNLKGTTQYVFWVRGKTSQGWGQYSLPLYHWTTHKAPDTTSKPGNHYAGGSNDAEGIIAGSVVAVVVCLLIVIIMVVIYFKRHQRFCNEKHHGDCDNLHYTNVQCPPPIVVETPHPYHGGLTVPLFAPAHHCRTYVDPHTYEDPQQAVREFTKEIDSSNITIESVIGGGEFGDVCRGKLRIPGKLEMMVAIKTLKPGASEKNRLDFLTEASIMGQFDDPNVIYLEGVVTKTNPIMIVTEFMENGSLDAFLRTNDGKLSALQLVGMLRGIASGMKYLQEMSYVHRDLAARNILVNETLVCKVADFGLSREIEGNTTDGAYTTKGGKIPVRWTAPEAITYRKFTSASDVWSYGVVCWEVMSFGERPYWNWSNQDVIKAVDKGYRLPPPMDCPEAMHQLMLDCWQKERGHRPSFTQIVKTLDKLIRSPELLRKIAKMRPHNLLDPNATDLTRFENIGEWLTSIKMERYLDNFLGAGFKTMELVSRLSLTDLERLGVTLVGHQKKIMNSVQTLRAQISGAQVSEGFLV